MSRPETSTDSLLADARWLHGLARRLVRSAEDAEELVQEARIVSLHWDGPAGRRRAWLGRVVENLARMHGRAERARAARERAVARTERTESAAAVVERAEAQRLLVAHVLALDEPYRATILWRYFDGLSAAEIARRAGVPGSTVRTRLERGLAALRARMERDRGRSWAALLLPLARRAPPAAGTGATAMKLGTAAAGAAVLAAVAWWTGEARAGVGAAGAGTSAAPVVASLEITGPGMPAAAREPLAMSVPQRPDSEGELTGRIVTSAGEPVSGARVRASRPLARQWPIGVGERDALDGLVEEVARATTGVDGAFRLRVPGEAVLDLEVAAEGHASVRSPGLVAGEHAQVVLGRAARIQGRVTRRSGAPVAGALIEATMGVISVPGRPTERTRSDAEGRFALDGLAPGFFNLWVAHDEARPVLLAEGATETLDFVLEEPVLVHGVVTDGRTEAPIAGARVWVRMREEEGVRTDAEGRFRIPVEARAMRRESLHVEAPGHGAFERDLTDLPESGGELDFFLLPGRSARGRVVDAHGAPVAGALVCASARAGQDGVDRSDGRSTRTDSEGRFLLADLRVDLRHTLLVRADGRASGVFDFPEREWTETELDLGDLPLDPPGSLAGRVVDPQGRALPGMWVFAYVEPKERDRLGPLDGGVGYLEGFGDRVPLARVDARGRFLFTGLPAGHVWLKADAKGWVHAGELDVELAPGERKTDLVLTVDPGHSAAGFVVDVVGRPVPGITVDACDAEGGRIIYDLSREDGSFTLHGLPEGAVGLRASSALFHGGHFAETYVRDVPMDARDVRLVVERAVELRVRVVDRSGAPLAGAYVGRLDGQDNVSSMEAADRDGRISVRVPERSSFDLMAIANRHFDPEADFFDAFFLDDEGKWLPEMTAAVRDLTASADEVVIVIPGLP